MMVNKSSRSAQTISIENSAQLHGYMSRVYNYMAIGLGITGVIAYLVAAIPGLMYAVHTSPLRFLFLIAPLAMVMFLSFRINKISASVAQMCFWCYAGLMGVSLSYIFALYSGESITRVFFITSIMFLSMSIVGHTTKRDLTEFGSFLFMGLIGVVVASVVNLFLRSSMIHFVSSIITVIVFTGLTAYDTQKIKMMFYNHDGDAENISKGAIYGALMLYLDFINIFISLLQLLGDRK